ncbi:MAG: glycine-rich domain-containing protein, partial [Bacteroidota bacterium]
MKKFFTLLIVTILLLISGLNLKAQTLQNIPCTGYNADVVANGAGTGSSTNADVDGVAWVFVANDFAPSGTVCSTTNCWPSNNKVTSLISPNPVFTLQAPTVNNSLRLAGTNSGTLTLPTHVAATNLYFLATGGSGACTFSDTIFFTDGTFQVNTGLSAADWCSASSPATAVFYRIQTTNYASCTGGTCQYMYQSTVAIAAGNQSKLISSIKFNNTGAVLNVFAVAGTVFAPCAAPASAPTAINLVPGPSISITGSFTASTAFPAVDHYLILRSTSATPPNQPVNGTTYTVGDVSLGATVVAYQTTTTISDAGPLTANTQYYYYIYSTYGTCTGTGTAPYYNTTPLTGSATTLLPMSGIYTIDNTQPTAGTNFNTFTAAVNTLNSIGIGGPVTFNVTAGQTFPITCSTTAGSNYGIKVTTSGTAANPIIFQKYGSGTNPVLSVSGSSGLTNDVGVWLSAVSYITFDGIDVTDPAATKYLDLGYYLTGAATVGCTYNTIKNCNVTLSNVSTNTNPTAIYMTSAATSATGRNIYNKFYNNTISNSFWGYKFVGVTGFYDVRNEIGNVNGGRSVVKNLGYAGAITAHGLDMAFQDSLQFFNTLIDSLRSTNGSPYLAGVHFPSACSNYNIYGDTIQNLIGTENYGINLAGALTGVNYVHNVIVRNFWATGGNISMFRHAAAESGTLYFYNNVFTNINTTGGGIEGFYTNSAGTYYVYNNQFYNINSTFTSLVEAIFVASTSVDYIYNNYISDLNCPAGTAATTSCNGIQIGSTTTAKVYYNTVYLKYTSTASTNASICLYAVATPTNLDMRNNIFVNKCDMTIGTRAVAFMWPSATYTAIASTTNNNIYYAMGNPYNKNFLFYNGTTAYSTLAAYKAAAVTFDQQSYSEDVPFLNTTTKPYNLRINPALATYAESGGSVIATPAITTDFDGNLRPGNGSNYTGTGSAPDIGASEFDDVPYWAPCVAPANPPTNLSVTGSTNTAIINFNASSTTTPNVGAAADHYLILRSTSATAPINTPVNGTLYLAKDITSFQSDGDTVLAYIECNTGTQVYLDSFNLHLSTQYYYYIYAANSICQTTPQYNTTPLIVNMGTACPAPTAAATTLILTSPSATHLSGSFTASASADHYLIYRSTSSTFSAVLPSNGVTYAIGSILGSGTTADTLVAYQTGVTFTDPATLIPTLQYYYYVIAANSSCLSGVPAYYTSTILSGGSYPTPCVAPINQPVCLVLTPGALSISGSFTAPTTGAPDHYLIVRSGSSNPTPPINGVNYTTVGQVITGAGSNDTVVAYQTTTSFTASSLISGVTYYFYVYAANSTNCAGPLYLLTSPLTGVATPALTANTSWVCPAGVTSVSVQAWGAGGAGGNLTTANSGALRCGGGGGGAYASGILTVTPNTSYSVVIGAAGVGNSGNTVAQATGGNTIFGSNLVVAAGGAGVGANTTAGASGGLATACTGNLVNRNGGNGGTSSGSYAGAGGGAGGTTAVGGNGGTYTTTGAGGASNPSSGTGGAGKYASTGGAGTAGSNYGGAGGGAGRSTGTTTYAGGAGTPGYAIISINPTAVPTSIALIPASTSITGSFTGANYATNYLIVKNTTGVAPTATPVNGTTYSSGTPLTGSTFVSYVSSTSFTDASLTPNVHYYYYIYTAKALPLSGGYVYVTTPLTGDVTTACAAPTAQPTALNFTPGATSMSATFTASASADNYLIVRSTSSSLSASPVVGTTYSAGTLLGGGTVISYQSSNSFTDNGPLTAGVLYYYYIFAANSTCTSGLVSYLTTSPLTGNTYTLCIAPTNQPTALNLTPTALTVSGAFTASVGGADHYLVIRSTSNTLSANPVNGTSYTAGTSLGGGTVVAYQTGITYNDINLTANTNYYYYIFAANSTICSGGPTYLNTTPLVNNTTTLCGIPAAQPTVLTLNPSTYSVSGSFIASLSTDNYLILRSTSSTFSSALPVNGTTYLPGDILGGLDTVVAFQPGTTFNDIQLNSSTIYYYFVFATNATCAGGPIYLTNAPLTTYVSTLSNVPCVAPANAPSALSLVPAATSMGISFTAAAGGADFYLLIRSLSSTLSATPANGTNYATGASLGGGTVISHQLGLTYTDNALSSGNLYYYYIYSYNAVCVDGPIYSASYLTGSSYTTCVAPTAQPTLLTFTPAVSSVSGIFTASASADHYLIVRSTASTLSATPVALTTYTAGTSLGGGTVVAYQTGTTFNDNGPLTTATLYYYFVFASNNICVNGPLYKTTTPLTSSTYTLCPAPANQPTNLAITASGSTASGSFIASTGSPAADHYLIVRNTTGILPTIPSNGVTYSSGIQLTGSTFIAYQTTTTLSDATLSAGTTYFYYIYAANSNNCSGGPIYATAAPIIGNVVPSSATTLTTSGSYTVPTGVTSITVYAFGGGGGGGGGYGSCSYDGNGGGGGGGGSAQSIL